MPCTGEAVMRGEAPRGSSHLCYLVSGFFSRLQSWSSWFPELTSFYFFPLHSGKQIKFKPKVQGIEVSFLRIQTLFFASKFGLPPTPLWINTQEILASHLWNDESSWFMPSEIMWGINKTMHRKVLICPILSKHSGNVSYYHYCCQYYLKLTKNISGIGPGTTYINIVKDQVYMHIAKCLKKGKTPSRKICLFLVD